MSLLRYQHRAWCTPASVEKSSAVMLLPSSLLLLPLIVLITFVVLIEMDSKGVRIALPKAFTGIGEPIECAMMLKSYTESLKSWSKANRCDSFIGGGGDEYDQAYPMQVTKRAPDYSYLDAKRFKVVTAGVKAVAAVQEVQAIIHVPAVMEELDGDGDVIVAGQAEVKAVTYVAPRPAIVEVLEVLEEVYIFDDDQRYQGHAKGQKEKDDYEYELTVLRNAHNLLRVQRAESLFACIQSSTGGRAAKVVSSAVEENPLDRCAIVLEQFENQFNVTSIRELPALEGRFNLAMPKNVSPREFIDEKIILRDMIESTEMDGMSSMTVSDAHFIVKILCWLPSNYANVKEHINNLIDTKGIADERGLKRHSRDSDAESIAGGSVTSQESYSGYEKVTVTLVKRLLHSRFQELIKKGEIVKASDDAVKVYFATGKGGKPPQRKCYRCSGKDHLVRDCPMTEEQAEAKKGAASVFSAEYKGKCRICNEVGHVFDDCPVVIEGRKVTGKAKPPIKKLGGINAAITLIVCNATKPVLTSTVKAPFLFMDDSGAASNIVNDPSLLQGVRTIDGICQGVGTSKVTHVGSFIGFGIGLDGSSHPVRLQTVYVIPTMDRNIFGTATFQRQPTTQFERSGTTPFCRIWQDAERTTEIANYQLFIECDDPFLWFKFHRSDVLLEDDKEWLASAMAVNALLGGSGDSEDDVEDDFTMACEVGSLETATIGALFPASIDFLESPLYGLKESPHTWSGDCDVELE